MMVGKGAPVVQTPLADGTGAIVIALVYGLLGPIVGCVLVFPIVVAAVAEFRPDLTVFGAVALLGAAPWSIGFVYLMAGALSLTTGIAVATVAHRRGRVSARVAVVAPVAAFVLFAILERLLGVAVPGAIIVRGSGNGILLWLAVCIAASLICWLLTLPIQRRMQ